jgi:uncharacterized protein YkwD
MSIAPTATAQEAASPGEAMVDRINEIRADRGLPALRLAPKLMRASRAHAKRLMRNDGFSHGSAYRRNGFRTAGEMLAYGNGWSLALGPSIRMWLDSAAHRGLMLSRSFRYVGASPVRGRYGGGLRTIWVVQLGAH